MNPVSSWLARRGARRTIPWFALYESAKLIYAHGRRVYGKYTPSERNRLGELVRKSKGRRANLTEAERSELWVLVKKAV